MLSTTSEHVQKMVAMTTILEFFTTYFAKYRKIENRITDHQPPNLDNGNGGKICRRESHARKRESVPDTGGRYHRTLTTTQAPKSPKKAQDDCRRTTAHMQHETPKTGKIDALRLDK